MKNLILFLSLVFFSSVVINAQQAPVNMGSAGLSFRISKSANIFTGGTPVSTDEKVTASATESANTIIVQLSVNNESVNKSNSATDNSSYVKVPIKIRSNSSYELYVTRISGEDTVDSRIGIANVNRPASSLTIPGNDAVTYGYNSAELAAAAFNSPSYSASLTNSLRKLSQNDLGFRPETGTFDSWSEKYFIEDGVSSEAVFADVPAIADSVETKILSGSRISKGGDNTANNYLSAEVLIDVRPESNAIGAGLVTYKIFVRPL